MSHYFGNDGNVPVTLTGPIHTDFTRVLDDIAFGAKGVWFHGRSAL